MKLVYKFLSGERPLAIDPVFYSASGMDKFIQGLEKKPGVGCREVDGRGEWYNAIVAFIADPEVRISAFIRGGGESSWMGRDEGSHEAEVLGERAEDHREGERQAAEAGRSSQ